MRDFVRDWHRWSGAERVAAVVVGLVSAIAYPLMLVLNIV